MIHSRPAIRSMLVLLCLAVFAARMGGAHLHLCLDGNGEPPASVHLNDDGRHHDGPGAFGLHHDVDISLAADLFSKKGDGVADVPALIAAAFIVFALRLNASVRIPRTHVARIEPFPSFRRLPPLRAPPV